MKPLSVEASKTRTTRYKAEDGGVKAVLSWSNYEDLLAHIKKRDYIILDALEAFDGLGRDRMARIDARIWHEHFRRRARKLGLVTKEKK